MQITEEFVQSARYHTQDIISLFRSLNDKQKSKIFVRLEFRNFCAGKNIHVANISWHLGIHHVFHDALEAVSTRS